MLKYHFTGQVISCPQTSIRISPFPCQVVSFFKIETIFIVCTVRMILLSQEMSCLIFIFVHEYNKGLKILIESLIQMEQNWIITELVKYPCLNSL